MMRRLWEKIQQQEWIQGPWHAVARIVLIPLRQIWGRFMQDEGPRNAAALTYTSLFAVVPLLTVIYSMLAALPAFRGVGDELQGMLFDHFVPATGAVMQDYMGNFADQARQLTLVGVAVLILTAGMMIVNIEKAFNGIWRVEKPRRGVQAFLLYWTVLTLGPLLLGAGMVLSSYLASMPLLEQLTGAVGGRATVLGYLPFIFSMTAFTLLYWAVPHCRVRLRDAALGGIAMALLFEVAKKIFTWFVTHFPSYELVYGAFAAVPVFLLWVYVSWLLILLCAQWVAYRGTPQLAESQSSYPPAITQLLILKAVWEAFGRGVGVKDAQLRQEAGEPPLSVWQETMQALQNQHWVVFDEEHQEWLPGQNLMCITLDAWLQGLPWSLPPRDQWPPALASWPLLNQQMAELEAYRQQLFACPLPEYWQQTTAQQEKKR